ncbi:MAG: thioredoxin family protein [Sedimentisphaerales bacterium]|nr:thioredoxin family protein [Sedimentisphaerales bacterium]
MVQRWILLLLLLGLLIGPIGAGCSSSDEDAEQGKGPGAAGPTAADLAASRAALLASPQGALVERIPDETMALLMTSGGAHLAEAFNQSILGQICHDPQVQDFYSQIKSQIMQMIQQGGNGGEEQAFFAMFQQIAPLVLDRSFLVGLARLPAESEAQVPLYGYLFLEAGPNKDKLDAFLKQLEGQFGPEALVEKRLGDYTFHQWKESNDLPAYWGWADSYFVLAVNDAQGAAVKYLAGTAKRDLPAADALARVHSQTDILAVHADFRRLGSLIGAQIDQDDPQAKKKILAVLEVLGLSKVSALTARMGFAGKDMISEAYLEVPSPSTGLLGTLKPIDQKLLDRVDAQAVSAGTCQIDMPGVYDTIMEAIRKAAPGPQEYQEVQDAIASFEQQMGFQIRRDILESLAGPMAVYTLPAGLMMEAQNGALVVCCALRDEGRMEQALQKLENFASTVAQQEAEGMLQISTVPQDGRTMHVWTIAPLAMLQVSPTWVVADGHWILATGPEVAGRALAQLKNAGPSQGLRATKQFQSIASGLPAEMMMLSYTDSRVQFTQLMSMAQRFWPMASMFAKQANIQLPPRLPSLGQYAEQMTPSFGYVQRQADGLYMYSRGPLPSGPAALVAAAGVGAAVVMPVAVHSRQEAITTVSLSHVRQIDVALIMYAQDNDDTLPENLESLVTKYLPNADMLRSPRAPQGFTGPSYIYNEACRGKKLSELGNQAILVYENPALGGDQLAVGFGDGHVERMSPAALAQRLQPGSAPPNGAKMDSAAPAMAAGSATIPWEHDYQKGMALAQQQKKPVLLVFSASWCPPCQMMKKQVYPDPQVMQVARSFQPIFVDTDEQEELAKQYEISGIPAYIVLAPNGNRIETIVGSQPAPDFAQKLTEALGRIATN